MFQTLLRNLADRVPGTVGVILAGTDGVLLEAHTAAGRDCDDLLAAEFAAVLKTCGKASANAGIGSMQAAILVTEKGKLLLETIVPDYFLLMLLEHEAHAGQALFEISRARQEIQVELAF